jgi:ribonuclease BN (tRNA processing enzyme)
LHGPDPDNPTYRLNVVDFYKPVRVLDKYDVTYVPAPHAVPAAGFEIDSGDAKLFYTGDATIGIGDCWKHVAPDVLLTEVTFGNAGKDRADASGHLTPDYLRAVLARFQDEHGRLPKVVVSHMNPPWEDHIRAELKTLAQDLNLDLTISHPGLVLEL